MADRQQFKVGDRVRFRYVTESVSGIVKEDRGPIGVKGRHLYLIQFTLEPPYTSSIEMPAEDLELIRESTTSGK